MRNKLFLFLLGSVLIFYFFPLFRDGIFLTHDGENHMARIASYTSAIKDGQFPVRWAENLNYSYGSPVFIFFYPLPYMLGFFFHSIGFSIVGSFKILLFLSFIGSAITFYFLAKEFVRKEVALISAVLYMVAPYHILNLYVRGDVGELLAYAIIPIIFYSIESYRRKGDILKIILGGMGYGLLILSHNGVSLLFSPIIFTYILIFLPDIRRKMISLCIIPLGLALSSFFWIPAVIESRYTNAKLFVGDFFRGNFLSSPLDFIISPWGFTANVNQPDGLAPQLGFYYFLILVISLFIVYKFKKDIKHALFWIVVFLIGFFLTLPLSTFFWENIPLLKLFQFPWRMIILSTFSTMILVTLVINRIKSTKLLVVILLLGILSTISFVRTREHTNHNDEFYYSFPGTTYFHGEATTIWSAGDAFEKPKRGIEIIEGQGTINMLDRSSDEHKIKIQAESEMNIVDNTYYFPGWKVIIDGVESDVQFQDPKYRGLITFRIPPGEHEVSVKFEDTKVRLLSNLISLSTIVCMVFVMLQRTFLNKINT